MGEVYLSLNTSILRYESSSCIVEATGGSPSIQLEYLRAFLELDEEKLRVLEGRTRFGWVSEAVNLAHSRVAAQIDSTLWAIAEKLLEGLENLVDHICEREGYSYAPYVYVVFRPSYVVIENGALKEIEAAATDSFNGEVTRIYFGILLYPKHAVKTIIHELKHVDDIINRRGLAMFFQESFEERAEEHEQRHAKYVNLYLRHIYPVAKRFTAYVTSLMRLRASTYDLTTLRIYEYFTRKLH